MIGEVEKGLARAGVSAVLDLLASDEGKNGFSIKKIKEELDMQETTIRKIIEMLTTKGRIKPAPDPKHSQRKIYFIAEENHPDAEDHKTTQTDQNAITPPQQEEFNDFQIGTNGECFESPE